MKQTNLKAAMSNNIKSRSLNNEQLSKLQALQNSKKPANKRYLSIAAAVLVFIISAVIFQQSLQTGLSIEQKIGNEVAKNHIQLKPLEVKTSQLDIIRKYFTELDFLPIASSVINPGTQALIGGRYCSIQGITAAQLRIKDNVSGRIQSLYQTTYDPKLFKGIPKLKEGQPPISVHAKGITVDIWVEKGLLFALTNE